MQLPYKDSKHFTIITICNRAVTKSVSVCMQTDAAFCHGFVQIAERD